jgi:uncharacterized protein (TIGR02996 family)
MADWIVYDGVRRPLDSTPLESYLRDLPARPDLRLPDDVSRTGYVAQWEVRADDTLWLTNLETHPADQGPDPGLRLVFPEATGPVFASWVSLGLRSPDPNSVRYSLREYGPTYDSHLYLWAHAGCVVLAEEIHQGDEQRTAGRFTKHLERIYSPDEASFLRAIHADRSDAAPRLVYADWLDERGDPRGTVIRMVERMRTMSPEAAHRERTAHAKLLARLLPQGLWSWVLGYDREAAAARAIATEW